MSRDVSFLEGKTALVTGASGDIGFGLCQRLISYGIQLVITGRNPEILEKRAEDLRAAGGKVLTYVGNLESEAFMDRLINYTIDNYESLDILINSAGLAHKSPIEDVTPELFDTIMKVNVRAPFFLAQKALPYLRLSDTATVINMCSVVAHRSYVDQSAFTVSMHALLGASKALANEIHKNGENIRVHVITPGAVNTDLIQMVRPDLDPEDLIHVEDVADVMSFYLEHRHSAFITDEIRMHRLDKTPFI